MREMFRRWNPVETRRLLKFNIAHTFVLAASMSSNRQCFGGKQNASIGHAMRGVKPPLISDDEASKATALVFWRNRIVCILWEARHPKSK